MLRGLVERVRAQTGMTLSVGIGPSRLVAKTASASFKPAAFVAMSREQACEHFAGHPVRVLQGIGPKTAERLGALGLRTIGELQQCDPEALTPHVGARLAHALHARAHFHDDSAVEPVRVVKSRSHETTFAVDVRDAEALERELQRLAQALAEGLRARGLRARTISIKVRLDDWTTVTRSRTDNRHLDSEPAIVEVALRPAARVRAPSRPVRLLGVRAASFEPDDPRAAEPAALQLALPLSEPAPGVAGALPNGRGDDQPSAVRNATAASMWPAAYQREAQSSWMPAAPSACLVA